MMEYQNNKYALKIPGIKTKIHFSLPWYILGMQHCELLCSKSPGVEDGRD